MSRVCIGDATGRDAKLAAANAGKEGSLIVEHVKELEGTMGYNVSQDSYEDLVEAGVIDPTKVTRSALQNAASIAGLLLTTEALVTELPEADHSGNDDDGDYY